MRFFRYVMYFVRSFVSYMDKITVGNYGRANKRKKQIYQRIVEIFIADRALRSVF